MSPDGSIVAERLWKRFRGDHHADRLRDHVDNVAARLRGRGRETDGYRWALRDVSLSASPGDAVGLVGANGSGKSTLLKILSRVMYPYAGRVAVAGRVGALIDVRAGIHGDLTGRENVYLYGGLLGLRRSSIATRFDDIIDFAELSNAVDRPVRFYSKGMQTRLGFAVAAFLEPDVLLVDEVLAVGDATFQQRCLDRMRTLLDRGTTLVYVSHDLPTVETVCNRAVWLDGGAVRLDGTVRDVVSAYRQSIEDAATSGRRLDGLVSLVDVGLNAEDAGGSVTQGPVDIDLRFSTEQARAGNVVVGVSEGAATPIFVLDRQLQFPVGTTEVRLSICRLPLPRGRYSLWVGIFDRGTTELLPWQPVARLDVRGPGLAAPPASVVRLAPVHVEAEWHTVLSVDGSGSRNDGPPIPPRGGSGGA
jgi:ABC-type polysaccharide/polyol phosphate transport system ATPase subunit